MSEDQSYVAGIDVGAECVKVVILNADAEVCGRFVVPTRGRFENCIEESLHGALDDAQIERDQLSQTCATGFAARCAASADFSVSEAACHVLGARKHYEDVRTVVDIGGRDPKVIGMDDGGRPTETRSVRRCAVGIGTFLMFAARHLDVHPTQLEELAASAKGPAVIGSYCSVFAGSEILERLLEGATPEEVAAGCIRSVAERVFEIGQLHEPVVVTGGVAEYFPGVLSALEEMTGVPPQLVPEPIMAGALGAALRAHQRLDQPSPTDSA
jgi:predicted CoA-substrate-specific enzyme activase